MERNILSYLIYQAIAPMEQKTRHIITFVNIEDDVFLQANKRKVFVPSGQLPFRKMGAIFYVPLGTFGGINLKFTI